MMTMRSQSAIRCFLRGMILAGLGWLMLVAAQPVYALDNCTTIYDPGDGWVIKQCAADPDVTTPMAIYLDGVAQGTAVGVVIAHQTADLASIPEAAVIYSSGYVRLKQLAAEPFGSSFVLGPGYWPDAVTYHHNPQLSRLEIDTGRLPTGPLFMRAVGTNNAFDVTYDLVLPPPQERQTRLHVTQTYTATTAISINAGRRAEAQGLKLVQFSTMFVNQSGGCDGGNTDCHDSNAVRFIGDDLARQQAAFPDWTPATLLFTTTEALGATWFDALHTDDQGWQGNTPNVRIALDALPADHTISAQGWYEISSDPNNDNIGLWLHDDGPASQSWAENQTEQIGYWLLAQDNPPSPWRDLGLTGGQTFLDFESSYNCFFVHQIDQPTSGSVQAIAGYEDTAVELNYDIGNDNGNWAQVRCNFAPPLDLSAYDHLRFDWRGDPDAANSLEVGVISLINGQERIFGRGYHHATQRGWWGQMVIPFQFLPPWTAGTQFDPSQVSAIFFSVVKDPVADVGGAGSLSIDNLSAINLATRTVPTAFEQVVKNDAASAAAVDWLVSQQQSSGLLKSWADQPKCDAHTYDQALALLVFAIEERWGAADKLVQALRTTQNGDGSWFKSRDCVTLQPVDNNRWEGDIAWAIYALSRYIVLGGDDSDAAAVRDRAADWLKTRLDLPTGCLVIDHTEATIDAWWAFDAAGPGYADEADGLASCLLNEYWDDEMGRFKGGKNWWQPYLDNQTWGAAFLKAIGEAEKAQRALSYAWATLRLPAQGGQLYGLDGQGGPWSVWNEGGGQYVALGGAGANELRQELLVQQRRDGALPGSPDEFLGGGVWATRWVGVAPTAWLYFAESGEPFHRRPRASFDAAPTSGVAPLTVTFTGASSGEDGDLLWQFGDGVIDSAPSPTHTYTAAGIFTVTLTASGVGGSDTSTRTEFITVYEPVVAGFDAAPTVGIAPLIVTFTNTSTGDFESSLWDFGDSNTSSEISPTHTYTASGVYTVTLTTSGPGDSDTLTRTELITIYQPVVAGFNAAPTSGIAPLTVTFTNTSSGDFESSLWDFGDGVTATATSPTHTYKRLGVYTVSLVISGTGGVDTETKPAHVVVTATIYLLPVYNCAPATAPLLGPIANQGDGNYVMQWQAPVCPDGGFTYTIQEDDNPNFDSPQSYTTSAESFMVLGRVRGNYYYRVKGRHTESSLETPWSEVQSATVDHLTIDDFDDGRDPNAIGGPIEWVGPCVVADPGGYDAEHAFGGSAFRYRLVYAVTPTCYATWQTGLLGQDYSSFTNVTFMIKGKKGGEEPNIYLQNSSTHRAYVDIGGYLSDKKMITTDWQQVTIPLAVFANKGVDLTTLAYFQIVFEWEDASGTVYIDDIRFE